MALCNQDFMKIAIKEANKALRRGEVPVAAVITDPTKRYIIALASNRVKETNDPTAHAEILAIRAATKEVGSPRLPSHHLFVTLEPCAMCAAAISFARIKHLHFGAYDAKGGGVIHGARIFDQPTCHHRTEITSGHRERECSDLLKSFFLSHRKS